MKPNKTRKLIIIGDSVFPQIAYEYFTHDSEYEVSAFCVEREYLKREMMFDLPVVAFESVTESYSPADYFFFAALVFREQNQLRARFVRQAKEKGYKPASYISSQAVISPDAKIGEHCFICEATVVHQYAEIGDNVVLWSANQIGQRARVGNNCFTLPNAVISNRAEIGANCIVNANVSVLDGVKVADDKIIEIGALISENIK